MKYKVGQKVLFYKLSGKNIYEPEPSIGDDILADLGKIGIIIEQLYCYKWNFYTVKFNKVNTCYTWSLYEGDLKTLREQKLKRILKG